MTLEWLSLGSVSLLHTESVTVVSPLSLKTLMVALQLPAATNSGENSTGKGRLERRGRQLPHVMLDGW
jgi:hypothetical protein